MQQSFALSDIKDELQSAQLTPMMQQYTDVKKAHPDCLVFYRMGDFYELFFDDAVNASKILDIALTKRGKTEGTDIPMCGIPFHAHDQYMGKLIRAGYRVAICEQVETPEEAKARGGYKALVKREVTRIITPGTVTEDTLLEARENNYLAALVLKDDDSSIAWADLSTGELCVQHISQDNLLNIFNVLVPKEILIIAEHANTIPKLGGMTITEQPKTRFDTANGQNRLKQLFQVTQLDGFGAFKVNDFAALGALIDYIALTQKNDNFNLQPPKLHQPDDLLLIDGSTRRNLELVKTLSGERNGSLLSVVDRTVTNAGGRLLSQHFMTPLANAQKINERLDAVAYFVENDLMRKKLRGILNECPDIERALSRLALGRGGPRDLAALRDGLKQALAIKPLLQSTSLPAHIAGQLKSLDLSAALQNFIATLETALKTELPLLSRDGGFIADGFHTVLDELNTLQHDSKTIIAKLQAKYAHASGIPSLKIKHNMILGYFIEVTPTVADKAINAYDPEKGRDSRLFIHRQSLATSARFTTVELADLDKKISEAGTRATQIELQIFDGFVTELKNLSRDIRQAAEALAILDVTAAWAELAITENYTCPTVDESQAFSITQGRHPVVENALRRNNTSQKFIANDCDLNGEQRLWLLTGPNMAGKSTFLRQNALIAFMAQMGAYVPAQSAHIGVIDRLFSRVGAADDLAQGKSTFMVEMVETATIVHQATDKSLVILDEIGRGTATFDGLSLAWATLEYLHNTNKCRGLFATHYHELTALEETLAQLACYTLNVKEWKGDIVFLHEVIKGQANHSYGLHVARLAGMPSVLINRAQGILGELEQHAITPDLQAKTAAASAFRETTPAYDIVLDALTQIDPEGLSPREALDTLFKLKKIAKEIY